MADSPGIIDSTMQALKDKYAKMFTSPQQGMGGSPYPATQTPSWDEYVSKPPAYPAQYQYPAINPERQQEDLRPTDPTKAAVQKTYQEQLGRHADPGGLNNYYSMLKRTGSQPQIAQNMQKSQEWREKFLRDLYRRVLGREADQTGWDSYMIPLQKGLLTPEDIQNRFYNSNEYMNRNKRNWGSTSVAGGSVAAAPTLSGKITKYRGIK